MKNIIRVFGPGGITEDEFPAAIAVLAKATKLSPTVAKGLFKALIDMRIWSIDIPAGSPSEAKKMLSQLRKVHLLAEFADEADDPKPMTFDQPTGEAWPLAQRVSSE